MKLVPEHKITKERCLFDLIYIKKVTKRKRLRYFSYEMFGNSLFLL